MWARTRSTGAGLPLCRSRTRPPTCLRTSPLRWTTGLAERGVQPSGSASRFEPGSGSVLTIPFETHEALLVSVGGRSAISHAVTRPRWRDDRIAILRPVQRAIAMATTRWSYQEKWVGLARSLPVRVDRRHDGGMRTIWRGAGAAVLVGRATSFGDNARYAVRDLRAELRAVPVRQRVRRTSSNPAVLLAAPELRRGRTEGRLVQS